MRIALIVFTMISLFSGVLSNKSLDNIEQLIQLDLADSARIELEKYNEENLFNPAIYLDGVLAGEGKAAFKKFKSLEPKKMDAGKKQKIHFEIAHYYYVTNNPGMAISYFRKSILAYPTGELAEQSHYWMGVLCLQYALKKSAYLDTADAHFRFLVDLNPKSMLYTIGLLGIAQVRMQKNDFISGTTVLEMAAEYGSPDEQSQVNYLSWVLAEKQGDSTAQIFYASKLHTYSPEHLETSLVPFVNISDSLSDSTRVVVQSPLSEPADSANSDFKADDNRLLNTTLSLQLAAFTIEANAKEYLQKLDYMNINAKIVGEMRRDMEYFLIRIVGFIDRESAEGFAENNLRTRGISYYLVYSN